MQECWFILIRLAEERIAKMKNWQAL